MINNTNTGGTFRTKRNPFTQVSNSALRDDNLSLKAKGLYSLIQSYITMPNFILYKGHLMSKCKEKEKAFNSAWKELKDNGYLKQYRIPKGKNDTFIYEYELLDIADLTTPSLVNLNKNVEGIIINNENNENSDPKNGNWHTPPLVPYANGTICQEDNMPTVPYAKRGGKNNTNFKQYSKEENSVKKYSKEENFTTCSIMSSHMSTSDREEKLPIKRENRQDIDTDVMTNYIYQTQKPPETKKGSLNPTPASKGLESPQINTKSFTKDFSTIEKLIQDNIEYDSFLQNESDIDLVNNFVACIVDTILTDDSVKVTINNGRNKEVKPISVIKSVLMRINYQHIQYAIDQYKKQHHKITYKVPYIRNMLYNTYLEMNAHYTNQVRSDGVVW